MTTIEFDKKLVCGPEFVALRIIENSEEMQMGNIWIPTQTGANGRLAFGVLENVGATAAKEYGLHVGDYVMFDRLSTFAHTAPVAATRYNNIICLTNKDRSEFHPLKNMLFVEPDEKSQVTNVGGFYVANYGDKLNLGTITDLNLDAELNLHFKVGDRVLMSKGADAVEFGDHRIFIYKHDMIVATIEEE